MVKLASTPALVLVALMIATTGGCARLDASLRSMTDRLRARLGTEPHAASEALDARAEAAHARARRARRAGDDAAEIAGLRKAADLGHARAAYELGIAYTQGRGVPVDLEAGAGWINRAADLGDASAQFLVGSSLYAGVGVQRDVARGIELLERAADQGHARAQFVLGQAYVDGAGVPREPAWAARWYGQAALAGHVQAQYAYGVMFASGLGVPRDASRAYAWLRLAEQGGDGRAAALLGTLAGELTDDAIAAAESRVKRFSETTSAGFDNAPTIMFVQQRLDALGFRVGPVDGIAGPRTRTAIRAYQTASRLGADGEVSRALVDRLRSGAGS